MVLEYVRLRPDELERLRQLFDDDPDGAADYAGDLRLGDEDEEVSSRGMDTDKAWAGLQHLLAKLRPPVDVIDGGEPVTDDEWGYGAPRLLYSALSYLEDYYIALVALFHAAAADHEPILVWMD